MDKASEATETNFLVPNCPSWSMYAVQRLYNVCNSKVEYGEVRIYLPLMFCPGQGLFQESRINRSQID